MRIVRTDRPSGEGCRRFATTATAVLALAVLLLGALPPLTDTKDLQQEYLTALALRDGGDLFAPVADLAARYLAAPTDRFPHPSPHPPALALASLPLTLVPFPVVVYGWLALSVGLLLLVGRWLGLSGRGSLALAAWPPLWWTLYIGQLELAILALALLGWRAAAAGREARAGVYLGLAAALKLYPALLLLPYLARRRLRLVAAASAVVAASQLVSLAVVGPGGLVRYYREVVPSVAAHYARQGLNASPYGALLRLLGGSADVEPLLAAPWLAAPIAAGLALLALAALPRLTPEASPVALLVALPNAWGYYAVLALPQIAALLRSRRVPLPTLLAVAAASFVLPLVNLALGPVAAGLGWSRGPAPAVAGLLAAVQPAGFVALLALSLGRRGPPPA